MALLTRWARKLGFAPSISAALVDDWLAPLDSELPAVLAPRGGELAVMVDDAGTLQSQNHATWSLWWALAAGARWVPVAENPRRTQRLVGPATIETTVKTPQGDVVQRVAAGLVDGRPAAIVEIENVTGVAIAVGLVARPMTISVRGHIGAAAVSADGIEVDGERVVRFATAPASTEVSDAQGGDLIGAMPGPVSSQIDESIRCRSGGAQAAAVFPLPHTSVLRFVVELDGATADDSPVPSTDDVNRGWQSHLSAGAVFAVEGEPITSGVTAAQRQLLTGWTTPASVADAFIAAAESGHGGDCLRHLEMFERAALFEDGVGLPLLLAAARWFQLCGDAEDLEPLVPSVAKSAHIVAAAGTNPSAPHWAGAAFTRLADGLDMILQGDVADRIRSFEPTESEVGPARAVLESVKLADERWQLPTASGAALLLRHARAALLADRGREIDILPALPESWRGKSIEVLRAPVQAGTFSYGIRWHGPRPALLWEFDTDLDAPISVRASAIDPDFVSTEPAGETLLADPGWTTP